MTIKSNATMTSRFLSPQMTNTQSFGAEMTIRNPISPVAHKASKA